MGVEKILVGIIAALFQALSGTIIIFKQINDENNINKIKFFISLCLYCIVGYFFVPNEIRFILYMTTVALILRFILNKRDKKVILYAFNTEMILSVSEIIVTLILVLIGINSKNIVENALPNLLANILISILSIVIMYISFCRKIITKINELFSNKKKLMNYFYVFVLILYLLVLKNGLELILKSSYYVNIFFIIGMVLILTIIIKNELKSEQLKEQNQQMLNYVTKYEKIITEQGKANHEFKNQLMVIRGYAQMASPKLLDYLDSIMDDFNKTSSSYLISQLNKFPDGGIKGLLYYKLSIIEDEKIKYDINVESGIKSRLNNLPINDYKNITKILGVLLDNAIDASKYAKDKKIIISVIKEKNNVIFKICNTYKGEINISKIGTGYTTKGIGHGYGLKLVKDIIDSNNIYKLENMLEDEYYVSILKIDVKSKKSKP